MADEIVDHIDQDCAGGIGIHAGHRRRVIYHVLMEEMVFPMVSCASSK
jgi:hypothetical protein